MKRCKKIILTTSVLVVLATQQFYGQTDSTTSLNKKNEFGLTVGPVVLIMLGSPPNSQPLGLTYKRVLSKWAFRTNLTFKPSSNDAYSSITERTKVNDSTLIWNTASKRNWSLAGRIGVEYRYKFKRGWYLVTGIDIHRKHSVNNRAITEAYYKIDSIGNSGSAEQFYHTKYKEQKNLLEEKVITKQVGLGLTVGAIIPLNKKWLILTQFSADGSVGKSNRKTTDFVKGKTTSSSSTSFDFNTSAAFSELSLFYRF
jgi:hypothetical protein